METTSEAVDAGVLQYADSFVVGTGGFVEENGRRLNIRNVQPIQSAGGPRQGAGRAAGTASVLRLVRPRAR